MLPVSVAPHAQQPGQPLQEEALHPGGHGVVGGRGAVVDVDDEDGDDNGEGDEDHDEEQVFSNQRDHLGTNQSCQSAQCSTLESLCSSLRRRRRFPSSTLHSLVPSDCLLMRLTHGVSCG